MTCSTCGSQQPEGRRFCTSCGASLAAACPDCGAATEPGARFCGDCGSSLTAAPRAEPARSRNGAELGERRFVTVLFADLVGFTPFSEGRDAEEVRELLTTYFDRARDIIERFGGVVDKFIGDAVMAVWGADTAHEDDAERGVRAALELVDRVISLGETLGITGLSARVGLMSGETSVGPGGNEKGLVVGDLVNTASRLQSIAEPGTVMVGPTTRELAAAAIEFEDLGAHTVKGKTETVEASRAVRVIAGRKGEGRSSGLVAPFVGRDQEFRLLKDLLDTTGREGRVRLVSIIGEGGTGKSRLIEEFEHYIDGVVADIYWHLGNSPSYGEGLTFWALGEMVRGRCGIVETDDDHRTITKLRTALAEYVADPEARAWMEPRLSALLGLAAMPTSDRADLFGAWRSFFQHVALRGTTVMVFEDINRADSGLIEFIDEFCTVGSNYPVLLITLARPEILERQPGWGSGRANSVSIWLGPLADSDMAALISGMVPGVGSELVERLVTKAGGIPLYGVELVRMLHSRGAIVGEGGTFHVVEDVTRLDVPDSLHGVVGARIDQLPPADRELLQDASVLGQSFTLRSLAALSGEDEKTLVARLEPFVKASLLRIDTDPRSPERGQYQFVQSLIREVAHARLTRSERRKRHMDVARYFERMEDPELAAAVASHYAAALEASPEGPESEEISTRAASALLAAAQRAADLHSYEQAVSLSRQGMALSRDPAQRGRLLAIGAEAAHNNLLLTDAEELSRSAITAFEEAGDAEGVLTASTALARILTDGRRGASATEILEPLVAKERVDSPASARAAADLCRAYMFMGRHEEVLELAEPALIVAERHNLIPVVAELLITRGTSLATLGRAREGLALLRAALDLAETNELSRSIKRALTNLGYFAVADDWRTASVLGARGLEYARRVGEPLWLSSSLLDAYNDAMERGNWEQGDQYLAELDVERLSENDRILLERLQAYRLIMTGDIETAKARFDSIVERSTTLVHEAIDLELDLQFAPALIALAEGRAEEALATALQLDDPTPNLADVDLATYCALYLQDLPAIEQAIALVDLKPYRGARVDLIKMALEGGRQAALGDRSRAATLLQEAARRAYDVCTPIQAAWLAALGARTLGTVTAVGKELGSLAAELCERHSLGLITNLVPDGLVTEHRSSITA